MQYLYPCKPQRISVDSDLLSRLDNDPAYVGEVKKNGFRCLAVKEDGALSLWTRHKGLIHFPLPELRAGLKELMPDNTVVDGELLQVRTKTVKEVFYAFDIIRLRGSLVTNEPLYVRREMLEHLELERCPKVELAKQVTTGKRKLYYDAIADDSDANEGIVVKKLSSKYIASDRRCVEHPFWLKVKKDEAYLSRVGVR
jgi:ATP-dependent DNA ligase